MEENGPLKPRQPFRPTKPRVQGDFRPREMAPAFVERKPLEGFRPSTLGRYSPLMLILTFVFVVMGLGSLVLIGHPDAALVFAYGFFGLAAVTGLVGMIFSLLSKPRFFEMTWLILILANAAGPVTLAGFIAFNIYKEQKQQQEAESSRASIIWAAPDVRAFSGVDHRVRV